MPLDKNFEIVSETGDGLIYRSIREKPFSIYGVYFDEKQGCFLRMPQEVLENIGGDIVILNTFTAGGRVRFSTNSKKIAIRLKYKNLYVLPHMTQMACTGVTLTENTENGVVHVHSYMPGHFSNDDCKTDANGYKIIKTVNPSGQMKAYTMYLPLYNDVVSMEIGLDDGATLLEGMPYKKQKPILYYGSSITQGCCATRPDNAYQGFIEKWNNTDFINLGFSGHCRAEQCVVEYLATIDCSIFVCDYDHNSPDKEYLQAHHYALYETYRKYRPTTPIVFMTMPYFKTKEREARRKIIETTYRTALSKGDKNVYFINGSEMYGPDQESCTVDGLHPSDLGFYQMAKSVYAVLNQIEVSEDK